MARERIELSEEEIKRIETMAGLGLNVIQMAAILGMSKATFDRRMSDTPGANEALEKGRSIAAQNVMATAFKMAVGGKHPAMTMFWLKCRERWKETAMIEHSGPDGKPIALAKAELTDAQLEERIQKLLGEPKEQNS